MGVTARPAVLVNGGKGYVEIAMFGTDAYDRNILRSQKREFIEPVMVPVELTAEEVLASLNSGEKRLLKSDPAEIQIGEQKIPHRRLSKR